MIKKEILSHYKQEDISFFVNQDKDLISIEIPLPECPDITKIDGYGLPATDQIFCRQKYPQKLRKLESDCENDIDEIWKRLSKNQSKYKDEIEWIKLQWEYRLFGYWFFNNGKPTYIDGWHFYYMNYFHLDIGKPQYRDRDRRWFLVQRFIYNETRDFVHKCTDKENFGRAIPEKDGTYKMYDTGRRLFWGTADLKGRRFGDTYKALSIGLEEITRATESESIFGIQGEDDNRGQNDFKKVVHAWRKLPFFFMPQYSNSSNPQSEINFYKTAIRTSANVSGMDSGLEAQINYATTAQSSFYDGDKLMFYMSDEDGKGRTFDCVERWKVLKESLSEGNERVGFSIHPTTTGEFEKGGGARFKALCDNADYYRRNENGETFNGLCTFFFHPNDGRKGFIDKYGMSIIGTPTEEQAKFTKNTMGAKQYQENKLNALLMKGDEESSKEYRKEKLLYPQCYADAFTTASGDIGMPYEKIDARLGELMFDRTSTKRGNYNRMDDKPEGRVVWEDDPNGKWIISHELPFNQTNQKFFSNGTYIPIAPRFMASADTFRLNKTAGSRMSDGGGAVFWIRDKIIDPDDKDIKLWTTNRFVCTYQARPPLEIYCEDMLMMCEYWGAWMNPEINIANIIDHFTRRGRAGYLFYAIDKATGRMRNTPGYSSLGASKQEMFNLFISHLQNHCHREKHAELLNDCKNLKGLDDMTNFDRWAAAAGCLKGASEIWEAPIFLKQDKVDVGNFFTPRRV